jgi:hypothetical protein
MAYVGNHGVKLQGFLNANQKNPATASRAPLPTGPATLPKQSMSSGLNFNALQVRYEQRFVGGLTLAELLYLGALARQCLGASLEGNTPSPQDGNNLACGLRAVGLQPADRQRHQPGLRVAFRPWPAVSLQACQWADRRHSRRLADQRHQHRAGRHTLQRDLLARTGAHRQVSPQISATYRGANEYRPDIVPGQPVTQGRSSNRARPTPAMSTTSTTRAFV